jgi:hypothetical protein
MTATATKAEMRLVPECYRVLDLEVFAFSFGKCTASLFWTGKDRKICTVRDLADCSSIALLCCCIITTVASGNRRSWGLISVHFYALLFISFDVLVRRAYMRLGNTKRNVVFTMDIIITSSQITSSNRVDYP